MAKPVSIVFEALWIDVLLYDYRVNALGMQVGCEVRHNQPASLFSIILWLLSIRCPPTTLRNRLVRFWITR
ncbi:MAG: hypothetical protein ABS938_09890, partial [Psychrobacillus psychrodurans]